VSVCTCVRMPVCVCVCVSIWRLAICRFALEDDKAALERLDEDKDFEMALVAN
jgi:hypothetical protein